MYSFTELARSAQCAFDRLRATEVCTSLRRAGMLLCSAVPDCTKIPKCSARHHYLRRSWGQPWGSTPACDSQEHDANAA